MCQHSSLGETRLAFLHGTEGGQHIQEAGGPVIITGNFRTINEETNSKDAKEQSLSEHIVSDTNERKLCDLCLLLIVIHAAEPKFKSFLWSLLLNSLHPFCMN